MISRSECAAGRKARRVEGFTLIELIVVLAVLSLVAASVLVNGKPVSPATNARAAAQAISGVLRAARAESLMSNRSVTFTLDVLNGTYQWGEQPRQVLPRDIRVALLTGRDQLVADNIGQIRFDPDGGASGGRVTVAGGGRVWWVGVNWLSGRVSLAEKSE